MRIGEVLLIALAANLDNIGVGIAYGTRKVGLCFGRNMCISLIAFGATIFCGYLGQCTTQVLPVHWARIIGANMLMGVGVWVTACNFQRRRGGFKGWTGAILRAKEAFFRSNCSLTWRETIILGLALSINSMAGGFLAGIQGGDIFLTSSSIAIFSFLFILVGLHLGQKYAARILGERSGLIAGILLICIGFYQILT